MKKLFIATLLVCFLLGAASVLGAQETNETAAADLTARYNHIVCRIDLAASQAELLSRYTDINASQQKAKLDADKAKLKEYADANSKKEFNSFTAKTVIPDVNAVHKKIKDARKALVGKDNKGNRKELMQAWKNATAEFASCNAAANNEIVVAREKYLDEQVKEWNSEIGKMKGGKHLDNMTGAVAQAKKLKEKLREAKNDEEVNAKIEEVRQAHLKLWTQFHISRIRGSMEELNVSNAQINNYLANAESKAAGNYSEENFKYIWQNIKDASIALRDLQKTERVEE